jgi:hypothetical protein
VGQHLVLPKAGLDHRLVLSWGENNMKTKKVICPSCNKEFESKYNPWKGYRTYCSRNCAQNKTKQDLNPKTSHFYHESYTDGCKICELKYGSTR